MNDQGNMQELTTSALPDDSNSRPKPVTKNLQLAESVKGELFAKIGLAGKEMSGLWEQVVKVQRWADRGERASIPLLIKYVEVEDKKNKRIPIEIRMGAVRALGYLAGDGFVTEAPLRTALASPDMEMRAAAVQAFMSLCPNRISTSMIEKLARVLEKEQPRVQLSIVQLLGTLGKRASDNVVKALKSTLENKGGDSLVREAAVLALNELEKVELIVPALYYDDDLVREAAIFALDRNIPFDEIIDKLRTAKTSGEKRNAARVLGETADILEQLDEQKRRVLDTLTQIAGDKKENMAVRKAATWALTRQNQGIEEL